MWSPSLRVIHIWLENSTNTFYYTSLFPFPLPQIFSWLYMYMHCHSLPPPPHTHTLPHSHTGYTVQGSVDHCVIGVQILHQLVTEMNQTESMRSLTKHRKVASSFRDESLYDIFTLSCTLLQQINVRDESQVTRLYI